jgi:hypothetical protein
MELYLKRLHSKDTDTLGFLYSDDRTVECWTLEDAHHDEKIAGQTRIPAGRYKLTLAFSSHFQREMIYLVLVPDYTGIMIHMGNRAKDTEGCILVADSVTLVSGQEDFNQLSNEALNRIQPIISTAIHQGDTYITITDEDR